jgi:type I restriction enzyme M protein
VSEVINEQVKNMLQQSLIGFDIDVTMVRLGLMNLMMHGIENPLINYNDTLSKKFNEESQYKVIMANPPFTGSIDKADINEHLKLNTTKTELLFIETIYRMLKPGGTAGVIIPQGVLFGAGKAFIDTRKILLEKCELKAVISMPSGVFKPYAGVSTAILIFTKAGDTEKVWFYNMESDGYSLDDKRAKLDEYGDLQEIVTEFKTRNTSNKNDRLAKCFFVPKKEIVEQDYDLSFNRYKKEEFNEIEYEKPAVILDKLKAMENEISAELNEIEGMLG